MKKKVKDLTLADCVKICEKNICRRNCPLIDICKLSFSNMVKKVYRSRKEIEVDE